MSDAPLARNAMVKAERALASARILLDAGDLDGACNRAHYAMFDAARAALYAVQPSGRWGRIKTHSGLLSAFAENVVKGGKISAQLGKYYSQ